jgi:hypothetical protein
MLPSQGGCMNYSRFAAMIGTSTLIMFPVKEIGEMERLIADLE